jgi:Tol biopolymer transport system component
MIKLHNGKNQNKLSCPQRAGKGGGKMFKKLICIFISIIVIAILGSGCAKKPRGQIIFLAPDGFYIINADGTNKKKIGTFDFMREFPGGALPYIQWSPDRKKIMYDKEVSPGSLYEWYIVNSDGTGKTLIAREDHLSQPPPKWSPDGKNILFLDKSEKAFWVFKSDGTKKVKIELPGKVIEWRWRWLPEGKIIFEIEDGRFFIVNSDGSNLHQLKEKIPEQIFKGLFSADGKKIVYEYVSHHKHADTYSYIYNIAVVNRDGSNKIELGSGRYPVWSPDGKKIAYATGLTGSYLCVINADGTGKRIVTTELPSSFGVDRYSFSSDGEWIAFYRREGGVYIMDTNGRNLIKLCAECAAFAWLP